MYIMYVNAKRILRRIHVKKSITVLISKISFLSAGLKKKKYFK